MPLRGGGCFLDITPPPRLTARIAELEEELASARPPRATNRGESAPDQDGVGVTAAVFFAPPSIAAGMPHAARAEAACGAIWANP
jgi:hypothetical protein